MQKFDVIIVGAGPAGSTCALALKDAGLKVALIDKDIFPRDKTCGDAIPGNAFKLLKQILPESNRLIDEKLLHHAITESVVLANSGYKITMPWVTKAINATRVNWDNFLLDLVAQNSNTKIIQNTNIVKIEFLSDDIVMECANKNKYFTKLLIAADGALAGVSRKIPDNKLQYKNTAIAMRAYYKNVSMPTGQNLFVLNKKYPNAYFWIFPLGGNLFNVGFGTTNSKQGYSENTDLKDIFHQWIKTDNKLKHFFSGASLEGSLQGFKLPLYSGQQTICGTRYMLCGDAAHLIDPIQGHGIDKAMHSGYLAAQQAINCFKQNNFNAKFMHQYQIGVYNSIGKELARNRKLMHLITAYPSSIDYLAWLSKFQFIKAFLRKLS